MELPKSYVESASGINDELKSALIVKESVSASPMFIFPPMVTSPVKLESPLISILPKEAVPVPVMLFRVALSKAPLI